MMVTDVPFSMEKRLVEKLDLMISRCSGKSKLDNLIIVDGDEGYGKTNMAKGIGYYMAYKTGRSFGLKNMFFDIDKLLYFAQNTQDQVIVWDEAALQGMSVDWQNKSQKLLWKVLMVARKKRHIWIFNIPKFFKLSEYIVMDRAIALVHVYARNQTQIGRFCYYRKSSLQRLYEDYRRKRLRSYKKHKDFWGSFADLTNKIYSESEYDKMKDDAIMNIGKEKKEEMNKLQRDLITLKYKVGHNLPGTNIEKAKLLNVRQHTVSDWKNLAKKHPFLREIS